MQDGLAVQKEQLSTLQEWYTQCTDTEQNALIRIGLCILIYIITVPPPLYQGP